MWNFLAALVLGILKTLFVRSEPEERVVEQLEPQIDRGDHQRVLDAADALVQHRAKSEDGDNRRSAGHPRTNIGANDTTVLIARQGTKRKARPD